MLTYKTLKALHLISIICWMAGLFYLPRLFVYHTRAKDGSLMDVTFQAMERRLLRYIMVPSLIASLITGLSLIHVRNTQLTFLFVCKMLLASMLIIFQYYMSIARRKFAKNQNDKSELFFRIANEVPTVIMISIIFIVIFK